jgi:hypothetical protein
VNISALQLSMIAERFIVKVFALGMSMNHQLRSLITLHTSLRDYRAAQSQSRAFVDIIVAGVIATTDSWFIGCCVLFMTAQMPTWPL